MLKVKRIKQQVGQHTGETIEKLKQIYKEMEEIIKMLIGYLRKLKSEICTEQV